MNILLIWNFAFKHRALKIIFLDLSLHLFIFYALIFLLIYIISKTKISFKNFFIIIKYIFIIYLLNFNDFFNFLLII